VGPHGAGFTNMLFAPPGLKVVDLIDPNRLSHAYVFWSMAEEIGHEYWYLVADPVPGTTGEDDTSVPLDKLAATIERMGLGPRRSGV